MVCAARAESGRQRPAPSAVAPPTNPRRPMPATMVLLLLRRPSRARPRCRARSGRRSRRARAVVRLGHAVGQDLMHALALLWAELGLELGERAQRFLLLLGARLGDLIDQAVDARHVDGRPAILGGKLLAQFLDVA